MLVLVVAPGEAIPIVSKSIGRRSTGSRLSTCVLFGVVSVPSVSVVVSSRLVVSEHAPC